MAIKYPQESCAQALNPQKSSSPVSPFRQVAAVLFLTSILFCCASTKESEIKLAELSLEDRILQDKNQRLSGELIEHKNIAARLQMALVEKQVEINTVRKSSATSKEPQDFSQVDDLLARSRDILAEGNYHETCILAYQALSEVNKIQLNTPQEERDAEHLHRFY